MNDLKEFLLSIFNTNLLLREVFFSIIVFEPEDNEDNEKEYQTLHGEYKNLVSQYTIKTRTFMVKYN